MTGADFYVKSISTAVILVFLIATTVQAGSISDVEEDLPLEIDSAYPLAYMARELQWYIEYARGEEGIDEALTAVRFEFGFPYNGEVKVGLPIGFGQAASDGIGDVFGEFLYNINQETLWIPAFSIKTGVIAPTASNSAGVDAFAELLITKTVTGRTNIYQQVHFNYLHLFNDDVQAGERAYESEAILGYSRRITSSVLFVSDIYRRWAIEQMEENVAEAGLRIQITPLVIISTGAGFGFGDDSPSFSASFGFQVLF